MAQVTAIDILDFWFAETTKPYWFKQSDAVDAEIRQKFSAIHGEAVAGQLEQWKSQAQSALALTIILDQFSRNMFRGSPQAFAADAQACALSKYALDQGYDQMVTPEARAFFYLPLMHSENLDDQQRCVALYEALGNENSLGFAKEHRDIVQQFGRFPHRNAVLGRENTAQEREFLKTHSGF